MSRKPKETILSFSFYLNQGARIGWIQMRSNSTSFFFRVRTTTGIFQNEYIDAITDSTLLTKLGNVITHTHTYTHFTSHKRKVKDEKRIDKCSTPSRRQFISYWFFLPPFCNNLNSYTFSHDHYTEHIFFVLRLSLLANWKIFQIFRHCIRNGGTVLFRINEMKAKTSIWWHSFGQFRFFIQCL